MRSWKEVRVQVVRASCGEWVPDRHLDPCWFRQRIIDFDLWYIYAGRGRLRRGTESCEIAHGSIICFKPGIEYEASQDEQDRLGVAFVHFDFVDADGGKVASAAVDAPPFHVPGPPSDLVEALLRRIVTLHHVSLVDARSARAARNLATRLLESALAESEFRHRYAMRDPAEPGMAVKGRVVDRFAEVLQAYPPGRARVCEIARQLGLGTDAFIRAVKRETGKTPKRLMIEMRVRGACRWLRNSELSVSEIAYEMGYPDVFAFSRQFKERTGTSPLRYREEAAKSISDKK